MFHGTSARTSSWPSGLSRKTGKRTYSWLTSSITKSTKSTSTSVLTHWKRHATSYSPIHTSRSERLFSLCLTGGVSAMVVLAATRSEEHTSELQSRLHLVWRLLL